MRAKLFAAVVVAALVGALAWGASVYAAAQGEGTRAGEKGDGAKRFTPEQRVERMAKVLDLTDAQKKAIVAIIELRRTEVKAVIQDKDLARPEKRVKVVGILKSTQTSIRALLTPEQQTKYDALCGKVKERVKERIKERRANAK